MSRNEPLDSLTEWLEHHVERLLPRVHQARLDAYMAGDGTGESCEPEVVREDLRKALRAQVGRELPREIRGILGSFQDLKDWSLEIEEEGGDAARYSKERREAVERWNRVWRRLTSSGEDLPPSLSGLNFQYCGLPGINLTNADLRRREDGFGAKHDGADLRGAVLRGANLEENLLSEALLDETDLRRARLVGASLRKAVLRRANLEGADLRGAVLERADLTGANLRRADLRHADLHMAILDGADLSFARGLLLDENSVFRTRFTNRAGIVWKLILGATRAIQWVGARVGLISPYDRLESLEIEDPWSSLRRQYTGPNFFITLLFLFAFLVPYAGRAVVLSGISQVEGVLLEATERLLGEELEGASPTPEELAAIQARLPTRFHRMRHTLARALQSADDAGRRVETPANGSAAPVTAEVRLAVHETAETIERLETELAELRTDLKRWALGTLEERRYPVWQILMGVDTGRYGWSVLVCLLFVFNGLRWFLTITIAPMRDAEERSHITPAKIEYKPLLPLHKAVSVLFWLSLGVGVYTFAGWITSPVYKFW